MSTWEERMAAKATDRREAREAEEDRLAVLADPHYGHEIVCNHYGIAICGCGERLGSSSVVFIGEPDPRGLPCEACGRPY